MSDYSSNFPTQSPTFAFDAKAGKLDSRLSYSRSSGGTYMSSEKALSSENLLLQSQDFDTTWDQVGLSSRSGGNADPAGGTTAHRFIEDSSSATHRVYQTVSSTGKTSLTVYAKQAVGTRYLALKVSTGAGGPYDWVVATYDLAGGTPAMTTGTGATSIAKTSSQTLSGGGFYKCTLTVESSGGGVNVSMASVTTPSPANYGHIGYTGDGASAIDVAFSSLNSTGATDYNATTTQIHREYAPLLKTASADAPRLEYAADGQSEGLLIEAQASNLYPNSSDMTGNSGALTNVDLNVAVGPTGDLTADALRLDATDANAHYRQYNFTASASTAYTFSVYVKADGLNYIAVRSNNLFASNFTYFNLSNGTVEGSPSMTSTIESVVNGWYRVSVNATTTGSGTASFIIYITDSASSTTVATGDSYRAVLGTGIQIEASSSPSSLISTSGSTATRSADSCSVDLSNIGITSGQDLTAIVEGDAGEIVGASLIGFDDGSSSNYARITRHSNNNYTFDVRTNASSQAGITLGSSSSATQFAFRLEQNNVGASADGSAVTADTSATIGLMTTMQIGNAYWATQANGTISRVSIYSEPLSDANIQSLTSNP